jgi:hypothetical protein
MNRLIVGLVLVASLVAGGCGSSPTTKPDDTPQPQPQPQKDKDKKAAPAPM